MAHSLRHGLYLGQGRMSGRHETKSCMRKALVTLISSPMPSGTCARGRAQTGDLPSCELAET